MRRSRCILLVALVLVVHIFVWLIFRSRVEISILDTVLPFHKITLESLVLDKFDELFVAPKATGKLEDDDLFRLFKLDVTNTGDNEVTLADVFADASDDKNPGVISFDPRFTLGVVLDHFNLRLQGGRDVTNLQLPYFHWSDWTDLSQLHKYMFAPNKKKCSELFDSRTESESKNNKWFYNKPETFCINDDDLESDLSQLTNSGILRPEILERLVDLKHDPLSTGFHIFKFPGRSESEIKVLELKSYLNDFMPQPLSLVLLLPREIEDGKVKQLGSPVVKIGVAQGLQSRQRIIKSDMFSVYRHKHPLPPGTSGVSVNVELLLKTFIQYAKSEFAREDHIDYEKHLQHDMFVDNSSAIFQEMQQRKDSLNAHELNYMNALEISLNSPYPFKYFYEALLHHAKPKYELGAHYDWRFFSGIVNLTEYQAPSLFGLIKAWFQFTNSYKFNTWLAHGSLLSWFWNGMTFPWDIDFDVQMPIQDLHNLCREFNQSLVVDMGLDGDTEIRFGRYMVDCGTYISRRTRNNGNNNIDARFIEVDSGLYIDITGLAISDTRLPLRFDGLLPQELSRQNRDAQIAESDRNKYLQVYNCRNNHFARLDELTPLKLTYFEGQLSFIPNNYRQLLINEYKEAALLFRKYGPLTYVEKLRLWEYTKNMLSFIKKKYKLKSKSLKAYGNNKATLLRDYSQANMVISDKFIDDDDYAEYLSQQKDLMVEYLLTKDLTALHGEEIAKLDSRKSTKKLLIGEDGVKIYKPIRHDPFIYRLRKSNYNFVKANDDIGRLKDRMKSGGQVDDQPAETPVLEPAQAKFEPGTVPDLPPPEKVVGLQTDQDLRDSSHARKDLDDI